MDLKRIQDLAWRQMKDRQDHPAREPGWLYQHGVRTAKIACELDVVCNTQADRDVLTVGALFHDIGKGEKPHNEVGARLTRDLLADHCSRQELEAICRLVRQHNQRSGHNSLGPDVRLLQDADALDHVGPMGAWLAFYWSGTHSESGEANLAFINGRENRDYQAAMRANLNFDAAVRFFDERLAWEREFFGMFEHVYNEGTWHPDPR